MKQIKLKVPDNWNDITIEQYQKMIDILESNLKEEQKTMKMVSLFCNVSMKDLKNFAFGDLDKIGKILNSWISEDPTGVEMVQNIKFNGENYGVIPNMSDMTTVEFIDLESYNENTIENLHKIMSVLYRKQTEKKDRFGRYKIENYEPTPEKQELMKGFPMGYALGVLNFFFHLGEPLLTDSANYLEKLK